MDYTPETRLLPGGGFTPQPQPQGRQGGELSFSQIFGVLRRRYKIVLAMMLVGIGIGGFLASQVPPTYQANAVIRVGGERRALTGGMESPEPDVGRLTDPILSLSQLMRSRSVLGAVVDSAGLQLQSLTPEFRSSDLSLVQVDPRVMGDSIVLEFGPEQVTASYGARQVSQGYGQVLPLGAVRFAVNRRPEVQTAVIGIVPREVAIDWLYATLLVAGRPETDLIDIQFVSSDPRLAQQIVNRTVEIFQTFNIQSAKERSRRRRVFLEEQLLQAEGALQQAQSKLASFRSRLQIGSSESKLASEQNALLGLEAQRTEMEADRSTFRTLLTQLQSDNADTRAQALRALATAPAMAANPRVGGLYDQLHAYELSIDSMVGLGIAATNPDLILARQLYKRVQGDLVQAVNAQLSTLDAKIRTFNNLRQSSGQSIQALPAVVEEEIRLTRDVDALGRRSEQLEQGYRGARMAEEVEAGDVEIIDRAGVPYAALSSTTSIRLVLGLVLGLLLGGCVAFLLEALNTSIRRPEDIESLLHVPGLAVIPRLEAGPPSGRPRSRGLVKASNAGQLPSAQPSPIGTETQPFSVGTEAFRMLRTSLLWSDGAEQLRTLVVTSAAPGDGKTITAANLAASFANDGLQVLLVDCDVRRPRLHGLFRVPRSPGLLDVLAPSASNAAVGSLSFDPDNPAADDTLAHVLRPTGIHGLTLMSCGALPTNASNLLSGLRMRSLLKELKERFDVVILDTPPVLATADAGILGSLTDGVLLVVRAGQTDRAAAQRAHQQLSHAGARVIGAVLNDPKGELSQYGEYYYPYEYVPEKA